MRKPVLQGRRLRQKPSPGTNYSWKRIPRAYQVQVNIADAYKEKGDYEKAEGALRQDHRPFRQRRDLGPGGSGKACAGIGDIFEAEQARRGPGIFPAVHRAFAQGRSWPTTSAKFISPTKTSPKPRNTSSWPCRSGRSGPARILRWATFSLIPATGHDQDVREVPDARNRRRRTGNDGPQRPFRAEKVTS